MTQILLLIVGVILVVAVLTINLKKPSVSSQTQASSPSTSAKINKQDVGWVIVVLAVLGVFAYGIHQVSISGNKDVSSNREMQKAVELKSIRVPLSKVYKVKGQEIWLVKYFPDQNPGWLGPISPIQGKYKILLDRDCQELRGRIGGGNEFQVQNNQEIYIPADSSVEFLASQGGEVGITIEQIK